MARWASAPYHHNARHWQIQQAWHNDEMTVIADTHVHIYPFHDRDALIDGAFRRLAALAPMAGTWALCLTERHDCHAFRDLPGDRAEAHALKWGDGWIFAGRQIVTRERLEVLALTIDSNIPDGQAITDVLPRIRDAGGVPVLSWAPGKWFFKRGSLVGRLIDCEEPGSFLLGDTSLRPTIWPEPTLMSGARRIGFTVVAGSDPLPVPGEEKYAGTYATVMEGGFDAAKPVSSLRSLLKARGNIVGSRCGPMEVIRRLKMNHDAGKPFAPTYRLD
ncbi:MAG: hypothetical protein V1929_01545 [bacterium]